MSVTAIFAGVVAIAKAIPVIAGYIDKFYEFYIDSQISKIDKQSIQKKDKRKALMKAISKATTDEERKALSVVLTDVNNM